MATAKKASGKIKIGEKTFTIKSCELTKAAAQDIAKKASE